MARWETDWPTKRAETRAWAHHKSASISAGIVLVSVLAGAGLRDLIAGAIFTWRLLHGGH